MHGKLWGAPYFCHAMKLSFTDWIYLWEGRFYAPLFVARCFLYRINDHRSSLLVHHKPNVSHGGYPDSNDEPMKFAATVHEVDDVYVHFAPSDTVSLNDLVAMPPTQFKLSKDVPIRQPFGGLFLEIQKCELRVNGMFGIGTPDGFRQMFGMGTPNASNYEYQIEDTLFQVQSPTPIIDSSQNIPNTDACCRLWKISIVSIADNTVYDVNCKNDWSVTALRIKNGWHSTLAMQLARRKGVAH